MHSTASINRNKLQQQGVNLPQPAALGQLNGIFRPPEKKTPDFSVGLRALGSRSDFQNSHLFMLH